jgi:hypothetical protein
MSFFSIPASHGLQKKTCGPWDVCVFQLLDLKVYQPRFVMARDATLTWKVGDARVDDGKFAVIGVSKVSDISTKK